MRYIKAGQAVAERNPSETLDGLRAVTHLLGSSVSQVLRKGLNVFVILREHTRCNVIEGPYLKEPHMRPLCRLWALMAPAHKKPKIHKNGAKPAAATNNSTLY